MRPADRRRRPLGRALAGVLATLIILTALVAGLAALAACGGDSEPFTGLYWEPASGRRIEIRKDDEAYWLYYGVAERPYRATRSGDELRIAEPLGGEIVVRKADAEGELELVAGGKTTRLRPLTERE